MSSTNHTTNYNLPQFVGSDKPAWLGDINPAMSAIDSAMHANAVKAQQGVDDASTAQSNAETAQNTANTAITNAQTAQSTANTAIANTETNATNIARLANQLGITSFDKITSGIGDACDITLAQNSTGTIFKLYGTWQINIAHSFARTGIAGMAGYYGIATGLFLNLHPSEAYIVNGCGFRFQNNSTDGKTINGWFSQTSFAVGTDGQIYLQPTTQSGSEIGTAGFITRYNYLSCVYFNGNFGDTVVPEE